MRTARVRWAAAAAIATSVAIAAIPAAHAGAQGPPGVIGARPFELAEGVPVSLSPDGSRLASVGPLDAPVPARVCVHDTASLVAMVCSDPAATASGVHAASIAWAPDGRTLAFTEAHLLSGLDGDLWLMDTESGGLVNLDDDGYTGPASPWMGWPDATITLPMAPAFTPDGSGVTYGRLVAAGGELLGEQIVTVPVVGGEPNVLLTLPGSPGGQTYFGLRWAPDGSRLHASVHAEVAGADDGIWVLEPDASGTRLLSGVMPELAGPPAVAAVAADGRHLLAFHHAQASASAGMSDAWSLVDASTGQASPIRRHDPVLATYTFNALAGFSPDGRWLLTVSRGTDPDGQLWIRPVDGTGQEILLSPNGVGAAGAVAPGIAISWAADGTVLVPAGPGSGAGTLVRLEGGAP